MPSYTRMGIVFSILLLFLLVPFSSVCAVSVGVTDTDPKGANVRDAPSRQGKVVTVVAYPADPDGLYSRRVTAVEQKDGWFNVTLQDGATGWMHKSILGFCAGSMDDGPCVVRAKPEDKAQAVTEVPEGAQLGLEDVRGEWVRVSYRDKGGKAVAGWLPERCAMPSGICPSGNAVIIRNRTAYYSILDFKVATGKSSRGMYIDVGPGQSLAVPVPARGAAAVDCGLGLPQDLHFLFDDVPFDRVDALALHDGEDNYSPVLELFFKGKSVGRIAGTVKQDDLRGEEDERGEGGGNADTFASSSIWEGRGLLPPESPVEGGGAFAGHWKPQSGGEDLLQCLTIYEDGSWKRGYDKDVASDIPSTGMFVAGEVNGRLVLNLHSFTQDHEPGSVAVPGEKVATVIREGDVLVVTDGDGKKTTYAWEDKAAGQF